MFVTESCIPIASLDSLASLLRKYGTGEDCCCSFLDYYSRQSPRCTRFEEHACFHIEKLPPLAIYKALPGWCLLSKNHAQQVMNLPEQQLGGKELYPLFQNVWAPEEVFFPTALSLVGSLPGREVVPRSIMWAKWDERAKGSQRAHPILYDDEFGEPLVTRARKEGCFFMRKFKRKLNVLDWERIIFGTSNNSKRDGVDSDTNIETKRLKR
jgi:Core-2/I-Branching enzyme.